MISNPLGHTTYEVYKPTIGHINIVSHDDGAICYIIARPSGLSQVLFPPRPHALTAGYPEGWVKTLLAATSSEDLLQRAVQLGGRPCD